MKHSFLVLLLSMLLIACSSTYVYKPEPISEEHSFAYNIAKQTILTKKNSPLRDFTTDEIQNAELDLDKSTGALSIGLGVLGLLAGDVTGLSAFESGIHIAGGTASKISTSNHSSAFSRWIILLPKKDHKNGYEAQREIIKTIQTASRAILSKYGKLELSLNSKLGGYEEFRLDGIPVGNAIFDSFKTADKVKLVDIKNFQNNDPTEYYGFGFNSVSYQMHVPNPMIYNAKNPHNKIDYVQLLKEITAKLPKNYFAYLPSYPKTFYEDETGFKKYQDYSIRVPMIITEGKVHKFIKPNKDKS